MNVIKVMEDVNILVQTLLEASIVLVTLDIS